MVNAPAVSSFAIEGNGPAFAGSLFPFLFITIACGALSGFHALICSGTTPKMIEKEGQPKMIGYGAMLTESFVAIMALVTAVIIDQHLYFGMNAPLGLTGGTPESAAAYVNSLGLHGADVSANLFSQAAADVGEESIISRTGGAPTLAMGMSQVLSEVLGGVGLKAFWYHFAIMFEALFILTTVDAGTRVARFMLSDSIGNIPGARKFRDPSWRVGAWTCSLLVVIFWGAILLMGVTDPLGGINTLFPLFGIANQLLAAIALTVVFTVLIKKRVYKWAWIPGVPLVWDLVVTLTASYQKIFSPVPAIGYFAQHNAFAAAQAAGAQSFGTASSPAAIDAVVRNTLRPGHVVDHLRLAGDRGGDRRAGGLYPVHPGRWDADHRGAGPAVAPVRGQRVPHHPGRETGAGGMGRIRPCAGPVRARRSLMGSGVAWPGGRAVLAGLGSAARGVRWWVSSVMGDNAYARYLEHLAARHPGSPVPSEREYWRDRYAAMDANPGARCC